MIKKLLIINRQSLKSLDGKQLAILNLKHPRVNEPLPFLAVETNDAIRIYELMSYSPELSSVFINDYVQSDAYVYLAAEFNIAYFTIAFVSESRGAIEFKSLDEFKRLLLANLTSNTLDRDQIDNMSNKLDITLESLNKLFKINGQNSQK